MKRPDWILFDFGETLIHEDGFDTLNGYGAVLKCVLKNPRGASAADMKRMSDAIYPAFNACKSEMDVEVYSPFAQRLICETLGIVPGMTYDELDSIFWNAAAPCTSVPGASEMLDALHARGIRTGVISNIGFSGAALKRRLDSALPGNHLEFVIASSDYAVRKPRREIFDLALSLTGAKRPWYVGDNPRYDVSGASGAGMYPVWFRSGLKCAYRDTTFDKKPDCMHSEINSLMDIVAMVDAAD